MADAGAIATQFAQAYYSMFDTNRGSISSLYVSCSLCLSVRVCCFSDAFVFSRHLMHSWHSKARSVGVARPSSKNWYACTLCICSLHYLVSLLAFFCGFLFFSFHARTVGTLHCTSTVSLCRCKWTCSRSFCVSEMVYEATLLLLKREFSNHLKLSRKPGNA